MYTPEFEKGKSSLLFIISSLFAIIFSDLFFYKLTNILLIGTSYLCNAYNYELYVYLDYLCIIFIAMSYLNTAILNIIILTSLLLEYIYSKQYLCIYLTVKYTCLLALVSSLYSTFIYFPQYLFILVPIGIVAAPIYLFKVYFYEREQKNLKKIDNSHIYTSNDLTYLRRASICIILSICSFTAK